jgi:hypothetical protein
MYVRTFLNLILAASRNPTKRARARLSEKFESELLGVRLQCAGGSQSSCPSFLAYTLQ